jgi:hypothetical protein
MEKLERYLDQVCRSLGGPRAMRQHVRQELREHLLDAAAQHRSSGASEEEALDRALDEFGKPDDLRTELEAAHGYRMLAVAIEKAMQWKEMTMKAKWLWTSWAYVAIGLVITLEVFFITFAVILIVPKYQRLMSDGLIDPAIIREAGVFWMHEFLMWLRHSVGENATWILLMSALAWGLFEWRVRSENKSAIRFAALGTVAVALMGVVLLTGGSLVISFCLGAPASGKVAESLALEQISQIGQASTTLTQATRKEPWDWEAMFKPAEKISQAIDKLLIAPSVLLSLSNRSGSPPPDELRDLVRSARDELGKMQRAINERNAMEFDSAQHRFHLSIAPFYQVAQRLKAG